MRPCKEQYLHLYSCGPWGRKVSISSLYKLNSNLTYSFLKSWRWLKCIHYSKHYLSNLWVDLCWCQAIFDDGTELNFWWCFPIDYMQKWVIWKSCIDNLSFCFGQKSSKQLVILEGQEKWEQREAKGGEINLLNRPEGKNLAAKV